MKRIYVLIALVSALLAVPATASAFSGTVVAKKSSRHAVVVVSRGGVARTLRTPRFASLRTDGSQLRLAVEHRGEVFVTVPDGLQLPPLTPGDEIELVVTVDAAGVFTLVSVQADDEDDDDDGAHEDNGRVEVQGTISDLGP